MDTTNEQTTFSIKFYQLTLYHFLGSALCSDELTCGSGESCKSSTCSDFPEAITAVYFTFIIIPAIAG